MAYTLGALSLPYQCEFSDEKSDKPIRQTERRTLGGEYHYSEQSVTGGREITLECRERVAWWSSSDISSLESMISAGGTYTLTWDSDSYTVRFDYDRGPMDMKPALPWADYSFGRVYLREVA